MADILDTIIDFVSVDSWNAAHDFVEANPTLLDVQADELLEELINGVDDQRLQAALQQHRDLLRRCREIGVEQAFAEYGVAPAAKHSGTVVPAEFVADIVEAQRLTEAAVVDSAAAQALIKLYQDILNRFPAETEQHFRADVQINLGRAYVQIRTGDLRTNLERARAYYEEALRVYSAEATPLKYALIQNNLGEVFRNLPVDRGPNLNRAIECFREVLRFYTPRSAPFDHAMAQNNLGAAYAALPTGEAGVNLKHAIACYKRALQLLDSEQTPREYALVYSNLGQAYTALPTRDRTRNIKHAIDCFNQALRVYTPESAPFEYAVVQVHLGNAYQALPTGDQTANLEQAIVYYSEALRLRPLSSDPLLYAACQTNLGDAYRELPTGDQAANLERAVACFQAALTIYTFETTPTEYAIVFGNLGNLYLILPTGDRAANVELAISCYEEALRVFTREKAPTAYARNQNNLGEAYRDLPTGDRYDHLLRAINCFEEALQIWTPQSAPLDYALAQNNLGKALTQLPADDYQDTLTRSIESFRESLRFYKRRTEPRNYAVTQMNLGNAYLALPAGNRRQNLWQAIRCYKAASSVLAETAPLDYAMVQSNMGLAYSRLPTQNRKVTTRRAIACYQEALRFRSIAVTPADYAVTQRNLAELYFRQHGWPSALAAYQAAIAASEQLYHAGLSAASKASEVAENSQLYHKAAFAATQLNDAPAALVILEQGKTRLLSEALRLRISPPDDVPEAARDRFEHAAAAVRDLQRGVEPQLQAEHDLVQRYRAREQAAREANIELDGAIAEVRRFAPEFLRSLDLESIQSLISDDHTALLAFCITEQGSRGLVVQRTQDTPVQVVQVPSFTQADLDRLLLGPDNGWLIEYLEYQESTGDAKAQSRLLSTLSHVLAGLSSLLSPILSALNSDIDRLILLPSGRLFLMPLHAVPIAEGGAALVCDRYQVSYGPSAQVLADLRDKLRAWKPNPHVSAAEHQLYAVINPQADPALAFTRLEGEAVASLFVKPDISPGPAGTRARVIAGVRGRSYLHFSCHGTYNWNDPPQSGLALADGDLTLADLQSGLVDMSAARLVTLSACETGIVDVLKGSANEYVGVPAGFMLAGVPCVLSSLWAVTDISTALMMERFYQNHVKEGMDVVASLHKAQHWVRTSTAQGLHLVERWTDIYRASRGQDRWAFQALHHYRTHPDERPFMHPYFWAAFTINGW